MTDEIESHIGLHHFAACGEWRPVAGNFECARCNGDCPCRRPIDMPRPAAWGGGAR